MFFIHLLWHRTCMKDFLEFSPTFSSWIAFIFQEGENVLSQWNFFFLLFFDCGLCIESLQWKFLPKWGEFVVFRAIWRLRCFNGWVSLFGYILLEMILELGFFAVEGELFASKMLERVYFYFILAADKEHWFTRPNFVFHFPKLILFSQTTIHRLKVKLHIIQVNQIAWFLRHSHKLMLQQLLCTVSLPRFLL